MKRSFLDLADIPAGDLRAMLDRAHDLKSDRRLEAQALAGRTVALVFEKPSTRTRISFEVAVSQLGGHAIVMNASDMQLGRGESIADTARVLGRYVDAVMVRCHDHATVTDLAHHAGIPVINGLTGRSHPCQIMADLMTIEERLGRLGPAHTVAWLGDPNNVCLSLAHAAAAFGFALHVAYPAEMAEDGSDEALFTFAEAHSGITLAHDAAAAAAGARVVVTDTWSSMGDPPQAKAAKQRLLEPFRVTQAMMATAAPDAIFLHCLPAYRGQEVEAAVIDGPQSAVWDEAENRLHAQKAILLWCLGV